MREVYMNKKITKTKAIREHLQKVIPETCGFLWGGGVGIQPLVPSSGGAFAIDTPPFGEEMKLGGVFEI